MSRGRLSLCSLVLVTILSFGTACGPIEYVNTVTRGADGAVEQARAANAAKWSPYYWTRAVEYLRLARVEAASADFQAANRFGRLSQESAEKALEQSLRRAADPEAARELEIPDMPRRGKSGGLAPVEDEP